MNARVQVSVTMPVVLGDALNARLSAEGVSPRKKSRWVAEAVERLLSTGTERLAMVGLDRDPVFQVSGERKLQVFTFDEDLHMALVAAVGQLRMRDPYANTSISALVRTAIAERLGELPAAQEGGA